MKKILIGLVVLCSCLSIRGANPAFTAFIGTNNLEIRSNLNTGKIIFDGGSLQPLSARLSNLAGNTTPFTNWIVAGTGITLTTNGSGQVTIASTSTSSDSFAYVSLPTSGIVGGTNYGYITNLAANQMLVVSNMTADRFYYITISSGGYVTTVSNAAGIYWANYGLGGITAFSTNGITWAKFWKDSVYGRTNAELISPGLTLVQGTNIVFDTNLLTKTLTISSTTFQAPSQNLTDWALYSTNVIRNAASNLVVVLSSATVTSTLTSTNGTNFFTLATVGGGPAFSDLIWTNDTVRVLLVGTPLGGTRRTLEYHTNIAALRMVTLSGNGTLTTSSYTNFADATNIGSGSVVFGSNNMARSQYPSSVMGGDRNIIDTNSPNSFIGSGSGNFIYSNYAASVIVGGTNNSMIGTAFGRYNFMGGGEQNIIQSGSKQSSIVGGYNNTIGISASGPQYGAIVGGFGNVLYSSWSFIGAGGNNTIAPSLAAAAVGIVAGQQNAASGQNGFIGAGTLNTVSSNSANSVVTGGNSNTIDAVTAVIAGGQQNLVLGTATSVGGGLLNFGNGSYAVIGGGSSNTVGAGNSYAVIAGGASNVIVATSGAPRSGIFGGTYNIVGTSGEGSFILGGTRNTITVANSFTVGNFLTNGTASTVDVGFFDTNKTTFDALGMIANGQIRANNIKWNIQKPAITASNLLVSFATNRYECIGLTNLVLTNLVKEATTLSADLTILCRPVNGTMSITWPAYGAQHGYFFRTNQNNPILSWAAATNTVVIAITCYGTNMLATITEWP